MDPQTERSDGQRAEVVRNVVRHLIHCNTCRTSLGKAEGHEDAVAFLHAQRNDENTPAVERVLRSTAVAGKQVLAELVYELAKALHLEDETFAEYVRASRAPRASGVVSRHLMGTVDRVETLGGGSDHKPCRQAARSGQRQLASDERATLAKVCLELLGGMEGQSYRYRLLKGHALITSGEVLEAVEMLDEDVRDSSVARPARANAALALARGLMILDRHSELDELLVRARTSEIDGPILELYGVASACACGDHERARRELDAFARFGWTLTDFEKGRCARLTAFISTELDRPIEQVEAAIGAA